jgi:intracellular multiplication protein IcmQ
MSDKLPTFLSTRELTPEQQAKREQCAKLLHDYHQALQQSVEELNALDKSLDKNSAQIIEEKQKVYQRLLETIKHCLTQGQWQVSIFFQGVEKKLQAHHDYLAENLAKLGADSDAQEVQQALQQKVQVYVNLYQTQGDNLRNWVELLNNITYSSVGRPVYQEEQAVIDAIKHKPDTASQAYAALYIEKVDIIQPLGGRPLQDKLGHTLLTLREGAIKPENIIEFVRIVRNQKTRYSYADQALIVLSGE